MELFKEYTVPVVMAICFGVGYILKNVVATEKINRFIPPHCGDSRRRTERLGTYEFHPRNSARRACVGTCEHRPF